MRRRDHRRARPGRDLTASETIMPSPSTGTETPSMCIWLNISRVGGYPGFSSQTRSPPSTGHDRSTPWFDDIPRSRTPVMASSRSHAKPGDTWRFPHAAKASRRQKDESYRKAAWRVRCARQGAPRSSGETYPGQANPSGTAGWNRTKTDSVHAGIGSGTGFAMGIAA